MKKAVKFLISQACAGLFLDPGLRKTSITLAAILLLKRKKMINKVLVVAPLRVSHSTWPNELKKWSDFNGLTHVVLHGPKKDELLKQDVDIYLINPEGLDWLLQPTKIKKGKKVSISVDVRRFKQFGFDVLVLDELTKFKNYSAIRSRALKQVLPTFARRWGLTGSPAANGLMGLFGQMLMLDLGRSLGQYITHYRRKYFVPSFNGFDYTLLNGSAEKIYEAIAPVVLRMAGDDYLELPKLVENVVPVELPAPARKIYDGLEKDLFAELQDGEVTAKNIGVALGKCRQVANGAIYHESGLGELIKVQKSKRDFTEIHDAKLDALVDLVEELQGQPALIAYEFQHDLARLQARLKGEHGEALPYIGHGVSVKQGKALEDAWNRGELPLLAAHPMSIAHGLNLQESGQHVIWFAPTWDYELYDQFIRRLLRSGSKHKRIFSHLLVVTDSVDEVIVASLHGKATGQQALFTGLKSLQQRRRACPHI